MKPSSGIAAVFVFVVIGATVSQSQAAPAALRGLRSEIRRYDCEYKGKGYSEGEWAVDCDAKYDMCQCVYDWNKGKHVWDNCRDDPKKCSDYQSCSDCVWDGNDYKFCVAEKHCSADCDTCKKYESEGYCEFKGYCEKQPQYKSCSDCVWDGNDYKFCVAEKYCSADCNTCKNYESDGYCESKGYCEKQPQYKSCSDCVWDGNDYKFCVAEKYCSADCNTCKNYESDGYCESKGYCEASNPWSPVTKFNKLSNTACGFGGYAVEGADMSRYEDVSVSWCRNKCSKEKNCYGFDYDDDKTRCRVFHEYPWSQKYKKGVTCYLAEKKGGNSW